MSPLTQQKVSLEIIAQKNFYKKIKEYNQCYIHSIYFWPRKYYALWKSLLRVQWQARELKQQTQL